MHLPNTSQKPDVSVVNTILITAIALIAFAANSLLCRLALDANLIDPALFTIVRLISGAIALVILSAVTLLIRNKKQKGSKDITQAYGQLLSGLIEQIKTKSSWPASTALFVYALTFSIAYQYLSTGTGALILFGAVQITLVTSAHFFKQALTLKELIGLLIAFTGFVYLMLPGIDAPDVTGFILMSVSGIAWAAYTYLGLGSKSPLIDSCANFIKSLPLTLALIIISFWFYSPYSSLDGIYLAIISGAITSGVGYYLWYIALGYLTSTKAAALQLLVPIIATVLGLVFVSEPLSERIIIASALTLGGIWLVIKQKKP